MPLVRQYWVISGDNSLAVKYTVSYYHINFQITSTVRQGRIMVPPGPEAWKRLRALRTYIYNIDLIAVLTLFSFNFYCYSPSLLRNALYVFKQAGPLSQAIRAAKI